ncbi:predicted protein [Histoplasma capsulatum H143]|uniref:Uncharacterized protein n=1 Tax=Ajellomyces capsulatus (strain H143) TaxID=544712 RepID=C6H8Q6_AJECH|nr:predicted protein [Histoplasma capsulatum H143]
MLDLSIVAGYHIINIVIPTSTPSNYNRKDNTPVEVAPPFKLHRRLHDVENRADAHSYLETVLLGVKAHQKESKLYLHPLKTSMGMVEGSTKLGGQKSGD